MVPSSMDRDVMSDMSCRGYDMDNLDHVVGNASVGYRDEISVWNDDVGVDDGSWSLPQRLVGSPVHCLIAFAFFVVKNKAVVVAVDRPSETLHLSSLIINHHLSQ